MRFAVGEQSRRRRRFGFGPVAPPPRRRFFYSRHFTVLLFDRFSMALAASEGRPKNKWELIVRVTHVGQGRLRTTFMGDDT